MGIVLYGVEGPTDAPVAEKLINWVGCVPQLVSARGGKSQVDERLRHWNKASNTQPFLVLRDWDPSDSASCIPGLLDRLLGGQILAPRLALRIPVRSVEAWLMADTDSFKQYFKTTKVPKDPDGEDDPKRALVNACRHSRSATIRKDIVPRPGSGRVVGELYSHRIIDFASNHWDPDRARRNSPSLDRALNRLTQLVTAGLW